MMTLAEFRAHRELARRHAKYLRALRDLLPAGRLPFSRSLRVGVPRASGNGGQCCWCGAPTPTRRHHWHDECATVYAAALGRTVRAGGRSLIRPGPCEVCGDARGDEIDHRLALSVAWARDPDRAWRAWTVGNLRRLCHACHAAKSRADRARAADATTGQTTALPLDDAAPRRDNATAP